MSEVLDATRWVISVLNGDAILLAMARAYSSIAPPGIPYPFISVISVAPKDELTFNANRVITTDMIDVKVIAEGSTFDSVEAAADRIDVLLHAKFGPVPGKTTYVMSCVGVTPIMYTEFDATTSKTFRHLGRTYELSISRN